MLYKTLPLLVLATSAVLAFPTPVANPAPMPLVEPRNLPPPPPSKRPVIDPSRPPNPELDAEGRPYQPEELPEPIPPGERRVRGATRDRIGYSREDAATQGSNNGGNNDNNNRYRPT